jgi:hypothetical protein
MRAGGTGVGGKRRSPETPTILKLIVCALAVCVLAGAALATAAAWAAASPSGSPSPVVAGTLVGSPSPAGDPAPTESLTWSIAPATAVYGATVTAQGTVTPAAADQTVTIALDGTTVATATTDASGAFSATFAATVGGSVTATLGDGTAGTPQTLAVQPLVTLVKVGSTRPWGKTALQLTVAPATFSGAVTATVYHHGRRVARVVGHVVSGKVVLKVPTSGIGAFAVRVTVAAADGLTAPPVVARTLHVAWRRVAVGTKGTYAHIVLQRLAALHFRVPGMAWSISTEAGDSIVAFQKAYGLPRTYVFDGDDWRKLDTARLIKVRHTSPATHIEIDKTRQILMIVKAGKPYGIIAVSTGATGNTPVGRFHILWKAPSTSTWLGSATLWRTMDFYRNFAMHGYPEVPPYPASHGCVREPVWVADWTYRHSFVGETVYIYLS